MPARVLLAAIGWRVYTKRFGNCANRRSPGLRRRRACLYGGRNPHRRRSARPRLRYARRWLGASGHWLRVPGLRGGGRSHRLFRRCSLFVLGRGQFRHRSAFRPVRLRNGSAAAEPIARAIDRIGFPGEIGVLRFRFRRSGLDRRRRGARGLLQRRFGRVWRWRSLHRCWGASFRAHAGGQRYKIQLGGTASRRCLSCIDRSCRRSDRLRRGRGRLDSGLACRGLGRLARRCARLHHPECAGDQRDDDPRQSHHAAAAQQHRLDVTPGQPRRSGCRPVRRLRSPPRPVARTGIPPGNQNATSQTLVHTLRGLSEPAKDGDLKTALMAAGPLQLARRPRTGARSPSLECFDP